MQERRKFRRRYPNHTVRPASGSPVDAKDDIVRHGSDAGQTERQNGTGTMVPPPNDHRAWQDEVARRKAQLKARLAETKMSPSIAEKADSATQIGSAEDTVRAKAEAERQRQAQEAAARQEAERRAADEAVRAKAEAERQRQAQEAAARQEAERRAAEEAARAKAEAERQRQAQEAAARQEADRRAADQAARAKAEAERQRQAQEAAARQEAERRAAEEAARARAEAERQRQAQDAAAHHDQGIDPGEGTPKAPMPLVDPLHLPDPALQVRQAWSDLVSFPVDEAHLAEQLIITAEREDPAHAQFDVLRTRLLQALAENGWRRVAITSPTQGCGKTFTAANLAISLSRQENCRSILLDLDLRRPSLNGAMGVSSGGEIAAMLRGEIAPEDHLLRLGRNRIHAGPSIAFGFNEVPEPYAAELLQDPRTEDCLNQIEQNYDPHVMLFDLPPALYYDDVIAFSPKFDGVLLIIGGGVTTEKEVREVERRLGEKVPLLGMVLNKAEGANVRRYTY